MLVLSIPPHCLEGLPSVITKNARNGTLAEGSFGEVSPHSSLNDRPYLCLFQKEDSSCDEASPDASARNNVLYPQRKRLAAKSD